MKDVASIEIVVTMKSGEVLHLGSRPGEVVENFSFEHARGIVAVHPRDGGEHFAGDGKRTLDLKVVFRRSGSEKSAIRIVDGGAATHDLTAASGPIWASGDPEPDPTAANDEEPE